MKIYILYYTGSYDTDWHIWGIYRSIERARQEREKIEKGGTWTKIEEEYLED